MRGIGTVVEPVTGKVLLDTMSLSITCAQISMRIGFFGGVSNTIRLLSSVVLMELCLGADTGFTAAAWTLISTSIEPALGRGASVSLRSQRATEFKCQKPSTHVARRVEHSTLSLALLIPPSGKFPVFRYFLSIRLKQNVAAFLRTVVDREAMHSI
jgi:hypothetical protein